LIIVRACAALLTLCVRSNGEGDRYRDEIFPSVDVTNDIRYSEARNVRGESEVLRLDIYQPSGDKAESRALIVWIHGGGFYKGDKRDAQMVGLAERFARRGYVCASINYRLERGDMTGPLDTAVRHAVEDATDAFRFLATNAPALRIDTNRAAVGGGSAGAITSLHLAYGDATRTPGGVRIRAVVDFWGGLFGIGTMRACGPPLIVIHGTADRVVPFEFAEKLRARALEVGIVCDYHPLKDAPHAAWGGMGQYVAWIAPFLHEHVIGNPKAPDATRGHPACPE
jgi:acetyl esterase/lipase